MNNLRPYQQTAQNEILSAYASGNIKAPILCMPTGSGKTVVFASLVREFLALGASVMVLCNRKELIQQAADKLKKHGLNPALIIPEVREVYSNLYVASIDTLRNRSKPAIKVLIIDECHIRAFDKMVLYYKSKGVFIIGCTATPLRYGKAKIESAPETPPELAGLYEKYTGQLCDVYDKIIEPVKGGIPELIKDGFLVPCISYGVKFDFSEVKKKGNDYDEAALFREFDKPKLYAGVIANYKLYAEGLKTLVFNINVEHSIKMRDEFRAAGYACEHIDGETPKAERDRIFRDFQSGLIQILCNCAVATTGTDIPSIECIIINRATMSLVLFLQMAGRGGRLCPEIGKECFILIDQGANVYTHLYWQQERVWDLTPRSGRVSAIQAPTVKECSNCGALIYASATSCKYCETVQPRKAQKLGEAEFEMLDGDLPASLKKPLKSMTIYDLERFREIKNYKIGWVVRQLLQRGESALREYANYKGYQESWVKIQLAHAEKQRVEIKSALWEFIKANIHLIDQDIETEARKKLKAVYSDEQISGLLPAILKAKEEYKKGTLTE